MAYLIKSGDTLSQIAAANKTDVATLQKLNPNITDINKIYAGQSLNLPTAPVAPVAPVAPAQKVNAYGVIENYNYGAPNVPTVPAITPAPVSKSETPVPPLDAFQQQREEYDKQANVIAQNPPSAVETRGAGLTLPSLPVAPVRPSYEETYKSASAQVGLSAAEQEYNDATAAVRDLENEIITQGEKIKGELVSTAVINKKLVKLDADTANALREAKNRVNTAADMVKNKNDTMAMLMSATEKDYAAARDAYEFEYNKAMEWTQAINAAETRSYEFETNKEIQRQNAAAAEANRLRDDARAQLGVIGSAIKSGSMPVYSEMSQDNQMAIDRLDLQAYGTTGVTQLLAPAEKPLGAPYVDASGNKVQQFYDAETKQVRSMVLSTGLTPSGSEKKVYSDANLPGNIRQSVLDTLTDKEGAKTLGRELTITDMMKLYPEVNKETLQDYMDEFYDYETLTKQEEVAGEKKWWQFWK